MTTQLWRYLFVVSIVLIAAHGADVRAACNVTGTTQDDIQNVLNTGQNAILCRNTTYILSKPQRHRTGSQWDFAALHFKTPWQQIKTDGEPFDNTMARLVIQPTNEWKDVLVTAIAGGGIPGVQVRAVRINGGMDPMDGFAGYGQAPQPAFGWGLIEMGGTGTVDHIVNGCELKNTRGWTHVVFSKGDHNNPCRNGQITNNHIGPGGGLIGTNNVADGISLQCRDTVVFYNLIRDVTDGGIVLFGAPGSDVWGNDIEALNRPMIAGIMMVDAWLWDSTGATEVHDFTNTKVHGNRILATGRFIKIGLPMGRKIYSMCPVPTYNSNGAYVYDNQLEGGYMGYGYPVDGVTNWTVGYDPAGNYRPNRDLSTHVGSRPVDCNNVQLWWPDSFQIHWDHATGRFQPDYGVQWNDVLHRAADTNYP
jgi:hypothetical protein